ncbi:MAG: PorP/SprF family type IX secretion system membrane protein [Flavobacteriales bacterium]|nr:PorP/SprF family type IX secretion system membrane protein [Flavobacteriales bacterium]
MIKNSIVILLFIGFVQLSVGQDFHLSQFEASPMHLNPSMTGAFEGNHRLSLHYRNQWRSIATKPFVTMALSYDKPIKKIKGLKLGGFILNNRAGAGNYNAMNLIVSGSYDYALKSRPHHHFVPGIQFGFINKSVNIDKLMFGSQYTPQNGGALNPNLPSDEFFTNQSVFLFDLNIGGMYYFSSDASRINPFIGGSIFHLTQPKESFYKVDNRLPRRYLVHAGMKYNLSQKIQISGYVLAMQQTNDHEFNASLFGYYYFKNSDAYVMYGNTWRSKDAILFHMGLKYREFVYRFTYDINTSALSAVSNGRGGFEMSIVYIIKNIDPKPVKGCPRL